MGRGKREGRVRVGLWGGRGLQFGVGWSGRASWRRCHLSEDPRGVREWVMHLSVGRWPGEGEAAARALGHSVPGAVSGEQWEGVGGVYGVEGRSGWGTQGLVRVCHDFGFYSWLAVGHCRILSPGAINLFFLMKSMHSCFVSYVSV